MQFQVKSFDLKVSVGNVSKYINNRNANEKAPESPAATDVSADNEPSQYNQDLITHKWMIYIRSANCKRLDNYIKKVVFYLHSSYKPYDVVEVK